MDYKKAGVDIEAGYKSVELMKEHVKRTMRAEVLGGLGGFCVRKFLEDSEDSREHFLLRRSKKWKNRCCYQEQTDVEQRSNLP